MLQVVREYIYGLLFAIQFLVFLKFVLDKKIKISRKLFLCIVVIVSGLFSLSFLYFEGVSKNIVLIFISIIFGILVYKVSFTKSIFLTFIYMLIILITDLFVLFCVTTLFNMSKEFCYTYFAGTLLGDLTIFVVFVLIMILIQKPLRKLFDTQIDTDKKILIFSLLTFICILLFFYTIVDKFLFTNDILLYLLCILVLVLSLSNLIKQVIENRKLSTKYDKLLEFMTTYEEEIEKQRIMRHEIKNEFLLVRAKLLDNQKNEEIVSYIDEILKDKITVKQEHYAKFGFLPPNGIKGLCYLKVQQAESLNIKVSINISKKVRDFDINSLKLSEQRNLARILGVFLDNAREACNVSQDKKMGLEVYYDEKNGLKFIISNTFNNVVEVEKLGKERFSTKGKGRGHGLMLVNYILESNKVFNLKTEINGNVYTQNLTVKIKTSKF